MKRFLLLGVVSGVLLCAATPSSAQDRTAVAGQNLQSSLPGEGDTPAVVVDRPAVDVDGPAVDVAADLIGRILAGEDDEASWTALSTALDVDAPARPVHEALGAATNVPATNATSGLARVSSTAAAWLSAARSSIGAPTSAEALTVYAILLLLGVGLASITIGLLRRSTGVRRVRVARPGPSPRPRTAPRRRRRRRAGGAVCRDAERLEAHLRIHRAA